MKRTGSLLLLPLASVLGVCLVSSVALATSLVPVYAVTFRDAVTGDNDFVAADGQRYWTIDPGADSYPSDVYERPTVQNYEVRSLAGGQQNFASPEYFEYLDIVQARAGFDSRFLYIAIDLFGLEKSTSDGVDTTVGLVERYGFRISNDPNGAGGFLLYADQPELKNIPNTEFGSIGTFGYFDWNNDVGGSGIFVTKEDLESEVAGDGYEKVVISDGVLEGSNQTVLFTRVDPNDPTVVELALDYTALGFSAADLLSLAYLEIEAIKGRPKDPANYLWNDEYDREEAGSPYRALLGDASKSEFGTRGLENIYELDTLRGGAIPEPSTALLLGLGIVGWSAWRRRWR